MIEVENLSKRYGEKLAVDGLDFVVQPGVVTGFLGPNGAGKSTTMRMIAGLDEPTAGRVRVNGRDYRTAPAPMAELGILLEAKAVHTGRSARNHLLALAQTNGVSRRRVDELIDMAGLSEVAGKRVGGFSLGMGQRLGIASALLGDPRVVVLDEPVNGLDPEGVLWIRNLLKGLAAEGRTVFVSSHLMSEMALTATRLVVMGRGRLIADTTVEEFVNRAGGGAVTVRTPQADRLRQLLLGPDITVTSERSGVLHVQGVSAEQIGTTAWQAHLPIFELTTQHASLEEAFMRLTDDSVDFRSHCRGQGAAAQGHPGPGGALGVDEVPFLAVHHVHLVGRRRLDDRHRRGVLCGERQPVPHLQRLCQSNLPAHQHQPDGGRLRGRGLRGAWCAADER